MIERRDGPWDLRLPADIEQVLNDSLVKLFELMKEDHKLRWRLRALRGISENAVPGLE